MTAEPDPAANQAETTLPSTEPGPGAPRVARALAAASLALGILGLLLVPVFGAGVVFAFPAIVCGHLARWRARREAAANAGQAGLVGLILGYVAAAANLFVLVLLFQVCNAAHGTGC